MNFKPNIFAIALLCCSCSQQDARIRISSHSIPMEAGSTLYSKIVDLDAQVFEQGFNMCDLEALAEVIDKDFEFYHDQAGTNGSKESFIKSIDTYVCNNKYRAQRRLLPETMSVFPLRRNNNLYGAIQITSHEFYAIYPDGHEQLTDAAKLFTLWIKSADGWKMRRSFSYDHESYD